MDYSLVQLEELNKYKEDISNLDLELENYTIYNDDHQVLIWNYKGFNYIKNNKIKEVKIFNKDIYNIPLHMKINNYILIPDYEQEYTFNKLYIVNTEDMKVSEWKIDYNISFNSVFLGINDKSIFLLDKQNKKEYELVPHKKKIRIVGSHNKGLIYKKGKSEKVTINSLLNEKEVFKYNNIYNYELIDNKLYLSYIDSKIKYQITNKVVNNITYINNDSVYYIVDNILYAYNPDDGEYKILEYSEFKYNEKNPIYIN